MTSFKTKANTKARAIKWKAALSALLMTAMVAGSNSQLLESHGGVLENTVSVQEADAAVVLLGVPLAYWIMASVGAFATAETANLLMGHGTVSGFVLEQGLTRVLAGIAALIGWVEYWFLSVAGMVANWLMLSGFEVPSQAKDIWGSMVELVNIIAAGILVLVSLMMILGIRKDNYSLKKYMPSFITALVLVNASYVLAPVGRRGRGRLHSVSGRGHRAQSKMTAASCPQRRYPLECLCLIVNTLHAQRHLGRYRRPHAIHSSLRPLFQLF